jgi:hypothetical protein
LPFFLVFVATALTFFVSALRYVLNMWALLSHMRSARPHDARMIMGDDCNGPWWKRPRRDYNIALIRYVYSSEGDDDVVVHKCRTTIKRCIRISLLASLCAFLDLFLMWIVDRIVG